MDVDSPAPKSIDTAHRVAALNHNDKPFHVVLAQQFDRQAIDQLCLLADMIRSIGGSRQGTQFLRTMLSHHRAMLYFLQPSTRTFLSFTAACQIVGMPFNEVRDRSTSSEVKRESEDDTIRVLSQYFDLIIMRHPAEGFAEHVANMLNDTDMFNTSPRPQALNRASRGALDPTS